jgi:hypothetical protein
MIRHTCSSATEVEFFGGAPARLRVIGVVEHATGVAELSLGVGKTREAASDCLKSVSFISGSQFGNSHP